jgi:hypothetical protein
MGQRGTGARAGAAVVWVISGVEARQPSVAARQRCLAPQRALVRHARGTLGAGKVAAPAVQWVALGRDAGAVAQQLAWSTRVHAAAADAHHLGAARPVAAAAVGWVGRNVNAAGPTGPSATHALLLALAAHAALAR